METSSMKRTKPPILDYSSPALEHDCEQKQEDARREGIESYNESTFGQRRPFTSMFLELAILVVLGGLMLCFLPRGIARALSGLTIVAFLVWRIRRDGGSPKSTIFDPSRWW
jgi:hypothetical protein